MNLSSSMSEFLVINGFLPSIELLHRLILGGKPSSSNPLPLLAEKWRRAWTSSAKAMVAFVNVQSNRVVAKVNRHQCPIFILNPDG
jgi:hypothetical protein